VITVLIVDARAFNLEFHMYAVSFSANSEEFLGHGNGSRVWVLGVMNSASFVQSTSRQFAYLEVVRACTEKNQGK
jgi:hypothetical protein